MRKTIASFVVAASLFGSAGVARAQDPGRELTFSFLAAMSNVVFYTPAKVIVAAVGLPLGAIAGTVNGGDTRAAYAFWVPMVGGQYFLTSDQMDGSQPIEFLGSDYADTPSQYGRTHHGSAVYDALHHRDARRPCCKGSEPCGTGNAPCAH
jgi:hypothetical protein